MKKKINGYIEGYYGKLLNWKERTRIVNKLSSINMNCYFYAPKDDSFHRFNWREKYNKSWEKEFKDFCTNAKSKGIQIIIGISPGLDFDFTNFIKQLSFDQFSEDYKILKKKCEYLLKLGANKIALLFDDLPNNFSTQHIRLNSEGEAHAQLSNILSLNLKKSIYVVPRIYSNELFLEGKNYLKDFGNTINPNLSCFYCGNYIVEKSFNKISLKKISKILPTKIIIWDNFYANDYCPRKLFLGPLIGRSRIDDIMINATGLIETDLYILDVVKATKDNLNTVKTWKKILKKYKVPSNFNDISHFFLKPDFTNDAIKLEFLINEKTIKALDILLWQWKSPLAREWYPFLLGLKHDLQLFKKELTSDRIIKTQTKPLASFCLKKY